MKYKEYLLTLFFTIRADFYSTERFKCNFILVVTFKLCIPHLNKNKKYDPELKIAI